MASVADEEGAGLQLFILTSTVLPLKMCVPWTFSPSCLGPRELRSHAGTQLNRYAIENSSRECTLSVTLQATRQMLKFV